MSRSTPILRPALALFSVRLVLQQIGLALLVFVLSVIWLRITDASPIDVAGSLLLALVVFTIAGVGESIIIFGLSGSERTPTRLMRGALFLLLGLALGIACSTLLNHLQANDSFRAGYLNSRFPHSMRNLFSYEHILLWLGWIWVLLQAMCIGLIALIAVTSTASSEPQRAIRHSLHSPTYWVAIALGIPCAIALTNALTRWTPGHGLRIETLSLMFRLGLTVLADGVVVCLLLAVLTACLRQVDVHDVLLGDANNAGHSAPTGTPEESQPRTVDNP